jgi:hypothetical protein
MAKRRFYVGTVHYCYWTIFIDRIQIFVAIQLCRHKII